MSLPICTACGTQFDIAQFKESPPTKCKICLDPRQFVPPSGQSFTTLGDIQKSHSNKWEQHAADSRIWSIWTEPKFAIGQRAILLETEYGNILWDLITLLDQPTIDFINSKGGLTAIIISHPHYYTTHVEWAKAFKCPVYVSAEDQAWLSQEMPLGHERRYMTSKTEEIVPGVTAIKAGGHFDGSLVLHWDEKLFIADTLVTVPSAYNPTDHRRPGHTTSYAFMWSIPNMIPLPPDEVLKIWRALKPFAFTRTFGAFVGTDVFVSSPSSPGLDLKQRVLESAKIQVRAQGFADHPLLAEEC